MHNVYPLHVSCALPSDTTTGYLEINPLDYVYRSIGCTLQLMDPESDEAQYLLQSLHNTGWFKCVFCCCLDVEVLVSRTDWHSNTQHTLAVW